MTDDRSENPDDVMARAFAHTPDQSTLQARLVRMADLLEAKLRAAGMFDGPDGREVADLREAATRAAHYDSVVSAWTAHKEMMGALGQHLLDAHKPGEVDEEAVAILDGYHVGAREVAGGGHGEPGETTLEAALRLLKLAHQRGAFALRHVTVSKTPLQQRLVQMADRLEASLRAASMIDGPNAQEVADLRIAAAGVEKWAEVADAWRAEQRQRIVADWTVRTFGPEMMTPHERVLRVLEEALELAQAEGLPVLETTRMVDYVYARPAGAPAQEVGGLRLTILAYCAAKGLLADDCEAAEVARVLTKDPQHFRDRNVEKAHAGVGDFGIIPAKETP